MSKTQKIIIDAEIQAQLEGMGKVVSDLQDGIKKGTTKLNISKGIGATISKEIASFEKDFERIQKLTAGGVIQLGDTKEFTKKSQHLISTFENLQRIIGGFDDLELLDAKKLFPQAFNAKVKELKDSLAGLSKGFEVLAQKKLEKGKLESEIQALTVEIEELKKTAEGSVELEISSEEAQKKLAKAKAALEEISEILKEEFEIKIKTEKTKNSERRSELEERRREILRAKAEKFGNKNSQKEIKASGASDQDLEQFKTWKTELKLINEELRYLEAKMKELDGIDFTSAQGLSNFAKTKEGSPWVEEITEAVKDYTQAQNDATEATERYNKAQEAADKVNSKQSDLKAKQERLEQLTKTIEKLGQQTNFANIKKAFEDLNKSLEDSGKKKIDLDLTEDLLKSESGIKKLVGELEELDKKDLATLIKSLKDLGLNAETTKELMKKFGLSVGDIEEEAKGLSRAQQDMERLKDSILDFFSIGNTIQIFKTSVKNAIDTVKELDAVMTETAVVTDFSIGDMWEKLPEYAAQANELGTSIASLYQATTLYYQQGLQSNEAMSVGVETMKMARIANMNAADATTAMTAALRGFNMEINETSATRVNDVYSELAAITAADTSQIATAMGKTASIAASANMEFETTAALLAQIIETTQEAPETAGTAMKTIIARFTEVKKLFDEGMLTGKDEEGEEININRIDEALRKVGISLKDFLKGEKGIDDIFLELASKWDTLDLATQRYIATTAAGSRQQSRFLAMMSNYDRTMELVGAANNSAGASQEQFNKTLDSLDAKLQELKNAWAQFTMGLADSDVIKGVVDLLTMLLNAVNKITDFGSSGAGGFMTFLTRIATIMVSLKSGSAIFKGLMKTFVDPSSKLGKTFFDETGGLEKTFKSFGEALESLPIKLTKLTSGAKAGKTALSIFGKALPIGAVMGWGAAILAVVAILGFFIQKNREASTSVKLDKVNEEIKKLEVATEDTKNKIEEISSAKSGLDELSESFAGLTKGTDEWRAALIEINSQVISLLEKYPGLQSAVGENGQLTITEESWQNVLNSQQQAIENMSAMKIGLQSQALDLKEKMILDSVDYFLNKPLTYVEGHNSQYKIGGATYAAATQAGELNTDATPTSGALTTEEYWSLVEYFSKNSISKDNFESLDLNEIFKAAGIEIGDDFNSKVAHFKNIIEQAGIDFYNHVSQFDEIDVSRNQQNLAFVNNAIGSNEIIGGKEYTDAIANTIVGQLPENADYNDKILEAMAEVSTNEKDVAEEYARIFGYQAIGEEVYKDATMSERVDTSLEAMRYAIAANNVRNDVANTGKQIAESTAVQTSAELYDELVGGQDGSNITAATLERFKNMSNEEIAIALGYKQTRAGGFSSATKNMSKELSFEIFDIIHKNLDLAESRIKKQRETTANSITSMGVQMNSDDVQFIENQLAEKFTDLEVRGAFDSVIQKLEGVNDSQFKKMALEQMIDLGKTGIAEDFMHLSDVISGINWNSPIQAVSQLQAHISSSDVVAQQFANTVAGLAPEFLGAGSQMQELFISSQYGEITTQVEELLKTQDELTDSNIQELTQKYSLLDQVVENTSMTTEGLAQILTSVSKGKIGFEQVTDAIVATIGHMDTLGESTNKVLKKWQEMDFGPETSSIQDQYNTIGQDIKDFIEQDNFGDESFENRLNYLFGEDWDSGYGDNLVERMTHLGAIAQEIGGNMSSAWEKAGQGLDIFGNKIKESALTSLQEMGIQLDIINEELVFNVPDNLSFDEVSTALANAFSGSKELWDDLLVYMESKDPNFRRSWLAADYNTMGERIAESETTTIGDKKVVTEQEIETIATIQAEKSDKTIEEIKNDIREQLKEVNAEITIIPNLEGLNANEITQKLNEAFGGSFAEIFTTNLEGGVTSLNITEMLGTLEGWNVPEEIASQIANAAAEGADQITAIINGEEKTIPIAPEVSDQAKVDYVEVVKHMQEQAKAEAEEEKITPTIEVDLNEDSLGTAWNQAWNYFNNKTLPLNVRINGLNIPSSATLVFNAAGEALTANADGTKFNPVAGESLTGEEGPELVETKDGAYLAGVDGPQITYLNRGDVVHTAKETKEIYKRKGRPIPAYKGGKLSLSGSSGGTKTSNSSGSGDEDEKTWENPFDKLYNLVREIDEELRQRERIERRYEQLLTSLNSSANEIIKVSREELVQLEKERSLQEELIAGRKWQIDQYQSENKDLQNYAQVTQNERGEDILRIDWDAIEAVTDPDQGQKIEDYVSQLEEWFDELESAEKALWDIEDAVSEIKERGKDEYFDLEELIKDAIVGERQKEIDELSKINESINETNSQLMASIQKTIDQQRQDRDNARTEEELSEKQRRLLYLQQDTSGANDIEILKLQKEIDQGQEDYTDSLIDQKISALQEQNDKAAEQREMQISIMQAQLDNYVETGDIWNDVYSLMNSGLNKMDGLVQGSALQSLLQNSVGFEGMSELAKMKWLEETNQKIDQAISYLELGRQLEDLGIKENTKISFTSADGKKMTGVVDKSGNVVASDGKTYSNVFQGADGKYYAGTETVEPPKEPPKKEVEKAPQVEKKTNPYGLASEKKSSTRSIQWALNEMGYNAGEIDGIYGWQTTAAVKRFQQAEKIDVDGIVGPATREKFKLRGYNKGGLADFTGPAWLDGTKARPEVVLDAQDSRNFIQLRDILGSLLNRSVTNTSTENNGDIIYDIDINVESVSNDYDIEQIAGKIKSLINEDARYRNNNAISLQR